MRLIATIMARRVLLSAILLGLAVGFTAAFPAAELHAQQAGSPAEAGARVPRIGVPPRIDGRLDAAEWAGAQPIGEIRQRDPRPGTPASERTEVRVMFDRDNLYIGVECFDSDPAGVLGTRMVRDADLVDDDRIEILLDPYHDRRNAYYFATNPLGVLVDGLIIENGTLNREWDAIWQVRVERNEKGWTAEFAIPFKTLSFPTHGGEWGFNISRTIKRKIEEDRWASPRLDVQFLQVSEAGTLSGLAEMTQGRGLEIRPFVAGQWLHAASTVGGIGHNTLTGDPGLDVFYNITPNLRWNTTVNTDFGETEVDARQINLTRFPLFFPEKRTFFLENIGVFSFSNLGNELLPFFSRRIGLLGGEEIPIVVGSKLTGKTGNTDVGLLYTKTADVHAIGGKNFVVARVKQNLFRQSYVGAIVTEGNPASDAGAQTYGADLRLATSNILGTDRNLNFNGYWMRSQNEFRSAEGKNSSYGVSTNFPNERVDVRTDWRHIEANFIPALGFVPRRGVNFFRADVVYRHRPKGFLDIRRMLHELFITRYVHLGQGRAESWKIQFAPILWDFNSGEHIEFNYAPTFERLFAPFAIARGVVIPPGDYNFARWRAEAFTASKRPVEFRLTWWFGEYWSGRAHEVRATVNWKMAPHLQVSLDTNQTFARLPQGNFTARVFTARVNYAFTPMLSISNFAQYDNDSRSLGWQARVRWTPQPGNDVFMILNQGWLQEPAGGAHFQSGDRRVAAKIQYTLRL